MNLGDKVAICWYGIIVGIATIIGKKHRLYYVKYPSGQRIGVIDRDVIPYFYEVRINQPIPTHLCLRLNLQKKRLDQIVRQMFEHRDMDAEPGSVADIVRRWLGASVAKGAGRLSHDLGLKWTRL